MCRVGKALLHAQASLLIIYWSLIMVCLWLILGWLLCLLASIHWFDLQVWLLVAWRHFPISALLALGTAVICPMTPLFDMWSFYLMPRIFCEPLVWKLSISSSRSSECCLLSKTLNFEKKSLLCLHLPYLWFVTKMSPLWFLVYHFEWHFAFHFWFPGVYVRKEFCCFICNMFVCYNF